MAPPASGGGTETATSSSSSSPPKKKTTKRPTMKMADDPPPRIVASDPDGPDAADHDRHRPSIASAFVMYCAVPLLVLLVAGNWDVLMRRREVGPISWPWSSSSSSSKPRSNKPEPTVLDSRKVEGTGAYRSEVNDMVEKRRRKMEQRQRQQQQGGSAGRDGATATNQRKVRTAGAEGDDGRRKADKNIWRLRREFQADTDDLFKALALADALRQRDLTYHDGGSAQMEGIETYSAAIELVRERRRRSIEAGEATDVLSSGSPHGPKGINEEAFLDYAAKSTDGLIVAALCGRAKMHFMANMFERAVDDYDEALTIAPDYLDALTYRASTLIILGRYAEAGADYTRVLELDENRIFVDAFTGMSKVLAAQEEAVPSGWGPLVDILEREIPVQEERYRQFVAMGNAQGLAHYADALKRMHLAMFAYHDGKTKDVNQAWHHLQTAYERKMSVLPPFNAAYEKQRLMQVKQVFQRGFWPAGVGSDTVEPIFIIGFVRSGSTLLERVLDAHPLIVGTGEDSVFNGRLDEIRNAIVEASVSGVPGQVQTVVKDLADMVVGGMRDRWEIIEANTGRENEEDPGGDDEKDERPKPERFADKMLTNYMNVGFIHMLFPNALILHVAREPMDTIFSAFKHDFPPGGLDYTSSFESLAQLYHGYRDIIEHWDDVLPGRVTHVRYEDMVTDMPGVAKAIIRATGLPWDPDVLNFHKKKHAVNTLSTTQVRKGVYSHHLKGWKKYEEQLRPLVKLVGDRVRYNLKTTLPGYVAPPPEQAESESSE